MEIGYVKIWRKLIENFLYSGEKFDKLHAWLDLILLARFKKGSTLIRGVKVNLEPGELCWSQKSLAARWKWNERTVAKYLKMLEEEQMIQCRITHVTTIITILNWDIYNGGTELNKERDTMQIVAVNDTAVHNQVQTNKESNNEKKNDNNAENLKNVNKVVNNSGSSQGMTGEAVTKERKFFGFQASLHVGDKLEGEL